MKLKNKVAVVTGAGSGMGKAIANVYADEGAKVVVSDINKETAEGTVEEIKSKGGEAVAVLANVAIEEDVQALIDTTVDTFGTVDILVNNAGVMDNFIPAAEMEDDLWEKVFAVNSTAVMRTTRKVLPIFLNENKGVIVNIASNGGLQGGRAGAAYTASKHAVIGFTKNTGFMYAKSGVRCNAVAPGSVETNIASTLTNVSEFGMGQSRPGMATNPRLAQPDEIAKVALFLATDDASFVNATTVTVDGGWTAY
ncbi:NAD(P)-dependent dehydrogenase (short-subunit alcohol dehydrogenase family) [Metabacillus crassostreae]|uniref:SDR family oxidoreductase n=1 Tax=Metabacillus crassostreae TaxID=929098 RepID=UPI00195917CD|nr:SDR family oxidoreductase [Metabacillus crassostreae]MBM7606640.1 NAD(P)-dependent dehydrogenase (short-subunit alcohol dehydrogenase family) [Metabacillus crassostreae]